MSKPVKVMQLIDSLSTGGAEMMAVRIANLLAEDFDSYMVVTRSKGELENNLNSNIKFFHLNKLASYDIIAFIKLLKLVKKNKIDIVHSHSSSIFWALLLKLFNKNIKVIWHDHNGTPLEKRPVYYLLKPLIGLLDFYIAINPLQLNNNLKHLHIAKNKSEYLRNFASITKNIQNRRAKVLIQVANFRPIKNHLLSLKAFEKIHHLFPGWKMIWIGNIIDEKYYENLKQEIKISGLDEKILIKQGISDVGPFLEQASIGILSSESEGLPVAVLEYGLAGLPVVATDVGGVSQVIKHEETGLLVPPGDDETFARELEKLISNEQLRMILGQNLNKLVQAEFSSEAYLKKLSEIYHDLLK